MARIKLKFAEDSIIEFFAEYTKEASKFLNCDILKDIKYEGSEFFKRVIYINYAAEYLGFENVLLEHLTGLVYHTIYKNKIYFNRLSRNHIFNFSNEVFINEMNKHDFRKKYVTIQKNIERNNILRIEDMIKSFNLKHDVDLVNKSKSIHKYKFCIQCEGKNYPRYLMAHSLKISEDYVDELLSKKSKLKRNAESN